MRAEADFDRPGILVRKAAAEDEVAVDHQRVAANLDRDAIERGGRARRPGEGRDAGGQDDLERALDADLLEAGDPEIAGRRAGRGGEGKRGEGGDEEGAHDATFPDHG